MLLIFRWNSCHFRLILNVAIYCGKLYDSGKHWFFLLVSISFKSEKGEVSERMTSHSRFQLTDKKVLVQTILKIILKNVLSFLLVTPFPWRKRNYQHAKSKYKERKVFSNINQKGKMSTLAANKHFYIHFSLRGRVFSIFGHKMYGPRTSEMDIKLFNPAPTQEIVVQI